MESSVHIKASRADLNKVLSQLPAATRASKDVLTRIGFTLLGRIRRAFITKARGGTDEAGDSWKPLSPKTIAYSRRGGRTKAERKRDAIPSQALNAKQQKVWWGVYRRALAQFRGDKSHAAAVAWWVLKKMGAQTLLDKYGKRRVEILRDTGLLFNSLSPGYTGPEQIFRTEDGAVVVGTNRRGAKRHHEGIPGRLPQRRLWPPISRWPKSWWDDIMEQAKAGVLDVAKSILESL